MNNEINAESDSGQGRSLKKIGHLAAANPDQERADFIRWKMQRILKVVAAVMLRASDGEEAFRVYTAMHIAMNIRCLALVSSATQIYLSMAGASEEDFARGENWLLATGFVKKFAGNYQVQDGMEVIRRDPLLAGSLFEITSTLLEREENAAKAAALADEQAEEQEKAMSAAEAAAMQQRREERRALRRSWWTHPSRRRQGR